MPLGAPTRRAMLALLAEAGEPVGVAQLTERLGLNQNAVRKHLARLVAAGLVLEERKAAFARSRRNSRVLHPAIASRISHTRDGYRGGTLVVAGTHLSDIPPLRYADHLFQERQLRSVTANTRRDGQEFLQLAARIGIRVETVTYPLDQADAALRDLAHDLFSGAAVLQVREY